MLKKLFANKKMSILIVVLALVLVGTLIAVLTMKDSKEDGKSGISIETDGDKDSEKSDDADTDEVYNGEGLEVEDTLDESVYTIDGSGDWDGSSNDGSKKEQGNKTEDAQSNDTQSDDTKKEDSNDKGDDADGELDNDILVDDKVWTDPS